MQKELEDYRFIVNPYNPCVVNKTTECGVQLTFIWHKDDLMSSCIDNFELMKFLWYLAIIYGPKLSMHTGKKLDYLGVDMEFNEDGTLDASMIPYLEKVIVEFQELIKGKAATPVRDEKEARPLKEERALAFHHTVAQLLFMATRTRRDIQRAVAFLTTRVKTPNEDDWGKLKCVLKYLNGTKYLKLKIGVEDLGILKWYVDGSQNTTGTVKGMVERCSQWAREK